MAVRRGGTMAMAILAMAWIATALPAPLRAQAAAALEAARAANARGDPAGARAALRPLVERLSRGGVAAGKA